MWLIRIEYDEYTKATEYLKPDAVSKAVVEMKVV